MAEKDAVTKRYMNDTSHFADAVNVGLFNGKEVVKPEMLHTMDATVLARMIDKNAQSKKATVQRYRDLVKRVTLKSDGKTLYMIVGIENQSEIDNVMTLRTMLSDAAQYMMQVDQLKKKHRRNHDKTESAADYLSGFYPGDKLIPVITLTVYFGSELWTAPTDLHSMLDASADVLRLVDNYHLHLIDPNVIADEDFGMFRTELRNVMKYVKHSGNIDDLRAMIAQDASYQNLSRETYDTINIVTGSKLGEPEGKERVNMCKAIEQLEMQAKKETSMAIAQKLLARGKMTIEEIAELTELSVEEVRALAGEQSA